MGDDILNQLFTDMKQLLAEPAGSRRVKITDLTPRDGQQCKLATRVTTDDLLPLCASLDNCCRFSRSGFRASRLMMPGNRFSKTGRIRSALICASTCLWVLWLWLDVG